MHNTAEAAIPADFEAFRKRAYQLTGLDLTSYKAPQMHRRLTALLQRQKIASFAEYARVLETDAQRRQEFKDYVTINVSEFFRDGDRFGELERRILPMLLGGGAGLRVWSAGCSIGAEPYSVSILLHEQAPGRNHSILATDIDQTILDRARAGAGYLATDLRNAGAERIRKWFIATPDGKFSVGPAPRTPIRFQKHDLLRDPYPKGPFDLVACRNVVIYFTEEAKDRIYQGFVNSLASGGVLFVGGTEAIMRPQALGLTVLGPGFYRKA
ncbi:MAG: protein-glutamate O-methyltransferase CheR [Chloroflexi bacterium]|nr:protein-glutamate O-methyltransferase CheR [Chloroflexota bacterium]MBV9895241.1 protein-glutamate O-methyltransferase CheR [Chloroflexota bacterium]